MKEMEESLNREDSLKKNIEKILTQQKYNPKI